MEVCPNCGTAIKQGDKFCSNCGQSLTAEPSGRNLHTYPHSKNPFFIMLALIIALTLASCGLIGAVSLFRAGHLNIKPSNWIIQPGLYPQAPAVPGCENCPRRMQPQPQNQVPEQDQD